MLREDGQRVREWPTTRKGQQMRFGNENRTELNDLAGQSKPQVQKMVQAYEAWAARCGVLPWEQLLAQHR